MSESSHVRLDDADRSVSRRGEIMVNSMCCLFSSTINQRVGSGMTSTRRTSTTYWFIRQLGEATYGVRSVDNRSLPWGDEVIIKEDELMVRYAPEIERFETVMIPAINEHRFRLDGDDFSGFGYASSDICIDEATVRALFSLGLRYLAAGKGQLAKTIINGLLLFKMDYSGKDQFLFNDFGIALRKAGLHSTAVTCYRKALQYAHRDDHLYYNLSRAHYEQGQWWDCMSALGKCFEFNPELPVAKWLVELTIALAQDPTLLIRYEKPPVPEGVARRAALLAEAVEFNRPMETPAIYQSQAAPPHLARIRCPGRSRHGLRNIMKKRPDSYESGRFYFIDMIGL